MWLKSNDFWFFFLSFFLFIVYFVTLNLRLCLSVCICFQNTCSMYLLGACCSEYNTTDSWNFLLEGCFSQGCVVPRRCCNPSWNRQLCRKGWRKPMKIIWKLARRIHLYDHVIGDHQPQGLVSIVSFRHEILSWDFPWRHHVWYYSTKLTFKEIKFGLMHIKG